MDNSAQLLDFINRNAEFREEINSRLASDARMRGLAANSAEGRAVAIRIAREAYDDYHARQQPATGTRAIEQTASQEIERPSLLSETDPDNASVVRRVAGAVARGHGVRSLTGQIAEMQATGYPKVGESPIAAAARELYQRAGRWGEKQPRGDTWWEGLTEEVSAISDPASLATFRLGGLAAAPIRGLGRAAGMARAGASGAGGIGLHAGLSETARQAIEGELRPLDIAKETGLGIATGAALSPAGAIGARTLAKAARKVPLTAAEKVIQKTAPAAKLATEAAIFAEVGAVREGRALPTMEEGLYSLAFLSILRTTQGLPRKALSGLSKAKDGRSKAEQKAVDKISPKRMEAIRKEAMASLGSREVGLRAPYETPRAPRKLGTAMDLQSIQEELIAASGKPEAPARKLKTAWEITGKRPPTPKPEYPTAQEIMEGKVPKGALPVEKAKEPSKVKVTWEYAEKPKEEVRPPVKPEAIREELKPLPKPEAIKEELKPAPKEPTAVKAESIAELPDLAISEPRPEKPVTPKARKPKQPGAWARIAVPVSTRMRKISPEIERVSRRFTYNRNRQNALDTAAIEPFAVRLAKLKKSNPAVYKGIDLALKNTDTPRVAKLAGEAGLGDAFGPVRKALDDIYSRARLAGVDVTFLQDYYPRWVSNPDGLIQHLSGAGLGGPIRQAIRAKEKSAGRALSSDEKAHIANLVLQNRAIPGVWKPSHAKARTVGQVDDVLNQFYYGSEEALPRYINNMNAAIERYKLFGRGKETGDSVGDYVADLLERGKITASQETEARKLIGSIVSQEHGIGWLQDARNLAYVAILGSPHSAITQFADLSMSALESGTYRTVKAAGKALVRKSGYTKEDIGIHHIAAEFAGTRKTAKAVNKVFKMVGLDQVDALGKEALINSALEKYQKAARSKKLSPKMRGDLERYFGKDHEALLRDLREGRDSEDVRYLMFNKLLDWQPVAETEMPEYYNAHPNAKIFYQLKSFTIRRLDAIQRETIEEIQKGNVKRGMGNMLRIGTVLWLAEVGTDTIKDFLLGKPINLTDSAIDNVFRLFGLGKFITWQSERYGLPEALSKQYLVPPAIGPINEAWRDGTRAVKKLKKGEDISWQEMRSLQYLPLGGKYAYYWFGYGRERADRMEGTQLNPFFKKEPPQTVRTPPDYSKIYKELRR